MPWLRLTLRTDKHHAEAVSEALSNCGAEAVTLQDAEDQPLFEPGPGETPLWTQIDVTGLFAASIDTDGSLAQLAMHISDDILATKYLEPLEDKDWSRVWMDDYHPMQFGERVWIVPSWIEPPEPNAVNILADPLVELAPLLCAHLRVGGQLALSGILAEQADDVSNAYSHYCNMAPVAAREDWRRLSGQRN